MPPLGPVASHHCAVSGRPGLGDAAVVLGQAVGDELAAEHVVDHLGPEAIAVGAVLARLGDRDQRLGGDEPRVVVGARRGAQVALARVEGDPVAEAGARLLAEGVGHAGRVEQPVISDGAVGADHADGIAGVASDRGNAGGLVGASHACLSVPHGIDVLQQGPQLLHAHVRVPGLAGHLPRHRAGGHVVGPVEALVAAASDVAARIGQRLAAGDHHADRAVRVGGLLHERCAHRRREEQARVGPAGGRRRAQGGRRRRSRRAPPPRAPPRSRSAAGPGDPGACFSFS